MEGRVLQDWVTIRAMGDVKIVQGQPFWLDASNYRDVMAWLDVRETLAAAPGSEVQISYETAPTEDEALFTLLGGPVTFVSNTVTVTQMLGSIQGTPLARWFRWKLSLKSPSANTWDGTFRVLVAFNRPGYRTPTYMTRPISRTSQEQGLSPEPVPIFGKQPDYGLAPPSEESEHGFKYKPPSINK